MTARAAGRRTTIRDVALRAGVSIATVSKALNGSGRMTEATRARVLDAARELSFRPNALARGLQSRRSFTVGLLTDDVYGRFALPVMAGITEGLIDHGVSVFLCTVEEDGAARAKGHLDAMVEKQVDGIVVAGRRVDRVLPVDLRGLSVPVVHAMSEGGSGGISLRPDEGQGARLAVEHLIDRGRRRIAHVTGPDRFRVARERADAWAAALAAAGLEPPGPALFGRWVEAWGHAAVARLWSGEAEPPDAVFCGNDQIARGVIDALRERGLGVPGDVAVVGFDNWEIVAAETRPPLTSVDMNLRALGREAGLTLLSAINGAPVAPGIRTLPCTLVVRDSSGGPG